MSQLELVPVLEKNPHFAKLSREHLETLAAAFLIEAFPDGHVLTHQGERGGTLYLLVSGEVEVSTVHEGKRHEVNRLEQGALFGLLSLVDNHPRAATCTAKGPVTIASLPPSASVLLFHAHAPISCAFQLALAMQLADDFRRIDARLRALYVEQGQG